jgi:hypothetical protein
MTRARRLLLVCASLIGLLIIAAIALTAAWHDFRQAQGIEQLDWQGLHLGPSGLRLTRLQLVQRDPSGRLLKLDAQDLRLGLADWRPHRLQIAQLALDWQPASSALQPSGGLPDLSDERLRALASWLPRQVEIASLQLELPCASGRCEERGALQLRRAGAALLPASGSLTLYPQAVPGTHRLQLQVDARAQGAALLLELGVLLDDTQRLSLQNRLQPSDGQLAWDGAASLGQLPEAEWLLPWLCRWAECQAQGRLDLPGEMHLGAAWALRLPDPRLLGQLPGWQSATGDLRLSADLPGYWPLPALGQLRGRLDLAASGQDGHWLPQSLAADLELRPAAALLADIPPALRPEALQLSLEPRAPTDEALSFYLKLSTSGGPALSVEGDLQLGLGELPHLIFDALQARLRSASLSEAGLQARDLHVQATLRGRVSADAAELTLSAAQVSAQRIASEAGTALDLQAKLDGLAVSLARQANGFTYRASGPLILSTRQLQHPSLRPLDWRLRGRLEAEPQRLALSGELGNGAGLALNLAARRSDATLTADIGLPALFFRAGNPLAGTLADWPATLEISSGRLQGEAQWQLPASGAQRATLTLRGKGLAGIVDTAEFSGLDAVANVELKGARLRVALPTLSVQTLNPGVPIGPLQVTGRYEGELAKPAQVRLSWTKAQAGVLGGRLWLEPGSLTLGEPAQALDLRLQGLQIAELLRAYPAEGLAGSGTLDGRFDARYRPEGLSIEQGSLAARTPGGVLRFRSARLEALAAANPAMKLVTEALHDFHYSLLTSDVRYDETGKLQLGLRIEGRNPALEGGRPINFTINLEEDIPALLTSLQLSDRVSETIQRRVQQRLQR